MVLPLNGTLEQVYREQRQQLFTCALSVTRSVDRAEDAIQEAFCRLFRLDVRPQNLKAYVFRTVRNAAIDQMQRNPLPSETLTTYIFDPGPGPHEAAVSREFQRQVGEALTALSADESETIVQHLYGDLTFREIAEIRETPLGTITSWYQRGLQKLRAELEK
jgi:RNA polymerase sigma-70 factor, ECF subfamily